ncbi:MAG: DNA recombination/repair protein RecA, partial [bacterium]
LLDVGAEFGIVKKAGSWYEYNGEKLGQGKESARMYLMEHKKLAEEIEKKLREYSAGKSEQYLSLGQEEEAPGESLAALPDEDKE